MSFVFTMKVFYYIILNILLNILLTIINLLVSYIGPIIITLYHFQKNTNISIHIIDSDTKAKEKLLNAFQPLEVFNDSKLVDRVFFHDDATVFLKQFDKKISFALINIEDYGSTKFKLDSIYEPLSNQGTIVVSNFDEENRKVVDEFVNDFELSLYNNHNITHITKYLPTFQIPVNDNDTNFDDLYSKIHQVIKNRKNSTTTCHLPKASIILTTSNYHMLPLLLLQHESMKMNNQLECLSNLFITLCMDKKCYRECQLHNLLNCAYVRAQFALLPRSSFNYLQSSYGYVNYFKILIHRATLSVVESFFFIEADVLLYRNPWDVKDLFVGRTADGSIITNSSYDFMYQRELPTIHEQYNDLSCGNGKLNGGQYYFKSTESTRNFLNQLVIDRSHTIERLGNGEQEFITATAQNFGVSMCAFAANTITGHCLEMRTLNHPISESITYHTACSGNPA